LLSCQVLAKFFYEHPLSLPLISHSCVMRSSANYKILLVFFTFLTAPTFHATFSCNTHGNACQRTCGVYLPVSHSPWGPRPEILFFPPTPLPRSSSFEVPLHFILGTGFTFSRRISFNPPTIYRFFPRTDLTGSDSQP